MRPRLQSYLFVFTIVCYLGVQIGFPVFKHYCGGELESVSLFVKGDPCCGEEPSSETEEDGCCQDELAVAQHHSHSVLTKTLSLPSASEWMVFTIPVLPLVHFPVQIPVSVLHPSDPPPLLVQRYMVQTSVLRI